MSRPKQALGAVLEEPQAVPLYKEDVWAGIRYEPHRGQEVIHASDARHRVAACGRRFGKSVAGGNELVVEAMRAQVESSFLRDMGMKREYWIVGPTYSDAEKEHRVLYDTLKRLDAPFDRPGTYDNARAGELQVSMFGGLFVVTGRSAAHENTLVGTGLDGALLVEAAKLKPRIWRKFIRPTLLDRRGWSLHTSTPEGRNGFHDAYLLGQDPNEREWQSWRLPSWVNERLFPEGEHDPEIEQARREMTAEQFAQEIEASFVVHVGQVFAEFDEHKHVGDVDYDRTRPLYLATDAGYRAPYVALFIQVGPWGDVKVLDEYYKTGRTVAEVVEDLRLHPLHKRLDALYPEPAAPADAAYLQEKLQIRQIAGGTGGDLDARLNLIRRALKLGPDHAPYDEQTANLLIDRGCRNLIREMQDYRYPPTRQNTATRQSARWTKTITGRKPWAASSAATSSATSRGGAAPKSAARTCAAPRLATPVRSGLEPVAVFVPQLRKKETASTQHAEGITLVVRALLYTVRVDVA